MFRFGIDLNLPLYTLNQVLTDSTMLAQERCSSPQMRFPRQSAAGGAEGAKQWRNLRVLRELLAQLGTGAPLLTLCGLFPIGQRPCIFRMALGRVKGSQRRCRLPPGGQGREPSGSGRQDRSNWQKVESRRTRAAEFRNRPPPLLAKAGRLAAKAFGRTIRRPPAEPAPVPSAACSCYRATSRTGPCNPEVGGGTLGAGPPTPRGGGVVRTSISRSLLPGFTALVTSQR